MKIVSQEAAMAKLAASEAATYISHQVFFIFSIHFSITFK